MKITISITESEDKFLQSLVKSGEAASISHAVRLAIHSMEVKQ